MKIISRFPAERRNGGFALVLVLGFIALIAIMVVTFLVQARSGSAETAAYSQQSGADQLAGLATQIVEAQLRAATTGGRDKAWASQPGMIRTWDSSGAPDKSYRLYSWDTLTVPAVTGDDISAWKGAGDRTSYNALWCDLNSPVAMPNPANPSAEATQLTYPIAPPPSSLDPANGVKTNDPIADPSNSSVDAGVQGYSITAPPGFSPSTPSPTNNPAPMPVKWLYVLQDGAMVAPSGTSTSGEATVPGASKDNPITGRVAYWTDDETCKVNLNTASEGTFWDVPRIGSLTEVYLGAYQPVQNEFQRYPGHPAMTCLSAIFPKFSATSASVYDLAPRVSQGGSLNGTTQPDPLGLSLTPDTDRLFASVDEYFYRPNRTTTTDSIQTAGTPDATVTKELNQKRFFLTANSHAPETTLFNTPRISMWPINSDSATTAVHTAGTRMDAFDKLLMLCASLGGSEYFFSRADAKSPRFDYDSIPRNQQVYAYLQKLTQTDVPGYGGNLSAKYGEENRDELLTQCFDFIRSGPNLVRASDMYVSNGPRLRDGYTCTNGGQINGAYINMVVPIIVKTNGRDTKGMGNFRYITSVGLGFYTDSVELLNASGNVITANPMDPSQPETKPVRMRYKVRPQILVQTHAPTVGWARIAKIVTSTTSRNANTRSLRYRATVASGFPSLNAVDPAGSFNAATVGSNEMRFRWGWPCEMKLTPDSSTMWDCDGAYFGAPTAFLCRSSDDRPSGIYYDKPFNDPTDGSFNSYGATAYRALDPVTLEFDVPTSVKNTNLASDKNKLWQERFQGMLTNRTTTMAPQFEKLTVDPDWQPRMHVSSFTVQVDLAYAKDADAANGAEFASSDLLQRMQVRFPDLTLPVPSMTYYNYLSGYPDYAALANGAVSNIQTEWKGSKAVLCYLDQHWIGDSFAGRYRKRWKVPQTNPVTYDDGSNYSDGNFSTTQIAWMLPGDVIRGMELTGSSSSTIRGDFRLAALQPGASVIPDSWFSAPLPSPAPGSWSGFSTGYTGNFLGLDYRVHPFSSTPDAMQNAKGSSVLIPGIAMDSTYTSRQTSASNAAGAVMANGAPGDFTEDVGAHCGGGIFDMADQGSFGSGTAGSTRYSYFNQALTLALTGVTDEVQYKKTYSPNRQITSPLQMGTLMTAAYGTTSCKPWQTLMYSPNSASTVAGTPHPGEAKAPDHTLADLFWMPVVDPYPISESLATAGKININYQIEPFHHITRATGMYALMKSTQITAVADTMALSTPYKKEIHSSSPLTLPDYRVRFPIAIDETLKGFKARFDAGKFFPSASAICEMFLYPCQALTNAPGSAPPANIPTGPALVNWSSDDSAIKTWWKSKRLTGDNSREQPYAHLYPRLTTKSNSFTVHVRAQMLKQRPNSTNWGAWTEGKDVVLSEYRGSETIERYLDPHDPNPVDFVTSSDSETVDTHYRFRTVQKSQFTP